MRHVYYKSQARQLFAPKPEAEFRGRVKWYDRSKGYGFIIPDGNPREVDLYFNESVISGRAPNKGDRVLFAAGTRAGKYAATVVRTVD